MGAGGQPWAARTPAQIASETGADPEVLHTALDREVRAHLADLARQSLGVE
jgi:hypothetical protein